MNSTMTDLSTHPHSAPPPGRAGGKRAAAAIAADAALPWLLGSATPAVAADATFTSARDIALGPGAVPRELAIGDFNSDGRQDLAIADASRDRVYSRLGNGDGTFRDGGEVVGLGAPADVVVADFDADGNEDLAVAAYSAGRAVSLLRGLGDGRFTLGSGFRLPGGEPATSLAVGDFDGDAQADLAVTTTAGAAGQRRRHAQ